MKMRKVCLIILCCLLMCSLFTVASGKTIYVDDDSGKDYTHIQDAINASNNGDTIFVYNGTYYEHVVVNKSIKLIGESKVTTIIDGNNQDTPLCIVADWTNITGFTIQDSCRYCTACEDSGIALCSNYNNIYGNIIMNSRVAIRTCGPGVLPICGFSIVSCNFSENNTISDNIITNNDIGIEIWVSNNNRIFNNNITNNLEWEAPGILLFESNNNNITNNTITKNYYGIYATISELYTGERNNINNTISMNIIKNNNYGILLTFAEEFKITQNTISNNSECGINLSISNDNVIFNNSIMDNYYGIYVNDDSERNSLSDNLILNNNENIFYESATKEETDKTPGFELILVLIAVALVLFWQRKRI